MLKSLCCTAACLQLLLASIFLWQQASSSPFISHSNIQCFSCYNAKTHEECNKNLVSCQATQRSCQTEIRVDNTNDKFEVRIRKGCKQTHACLNNEMQNDKIAWPVTQCNPEPTKLSVCRYCCNTTGCNGEIEQEECSALNAPVNGVVSCEMDEELDAQVCSFQCNECYRLVGSQKRMCMMDNTWSGQPAQCVIDPSCQLCDSSMTIHPDNGQVDCPDGRKSGSVCSFSCDKSYDLIGQAEVTCMPHLLKWSDPKPRCKKSQSSPQVRCQAIELEHGQVSCDNSRLTEGTTCEFSCDPCYVGTGSASAVCQQDKTWSGEEFVCNHDPEASNNCPTCTNQDMVSDPTNGATQCDDGARLGSTCSFTCNSDFELVGSPSSTCVRETGEWSYPKPTCRPVEVSCEKLPELHNGSSVCHPDYTSLETVCVFTCLPCHRRTKSGFRKCVDGSWTGDQPQCVYDPEFDRCPDEFCPAEMITGLENGEVDCTRADRRGSTCIFTCNDGYILDGDSTVTCTARGWQGDKPICRNECHPLAIASTDIPGQCVCVRGYEGNGYSCRDVNECLDPNACHAYAICTNTIGSFSCECVDGFEGDGFSCIDINECLNPDHQDYKCDRENGICFNEIGSYNCTCKPGYQGNGMECVENKAKCPPNNLLDDDYCFRYIITNVTHPSYTASDACTNVESGHPAIIRTKEQYDTLNAILAHILVPDNDVITTVLGPWIGLSDKWQPGAFRWRDGSEINETRDYVIWANGHPNLSLGEPICVHLVSDPGKNGGSRDFFWEDRRCSDDARYVCNTEKTYENLQTCNGLSRTAYSDFECTNGWNAGSTCTFTCQEGFILAGPTDSVTCEEGLLRWDNIIPHCIEAVCAPHITSPNGGTVECENGSRVGSRCYFRCHEGYQISGPSMIQCMPNLYWSDRKPCCAFECPPKARMNLVLVLDSSGSIGEENFNKIKGFAKGMYSKFDLSPHYTQVSVVSFHSVVELANNTMWFSSRNDLDLAFDTVSYAGKGTLTGQALQFTADNLVNVRDGASTVVVILTDAYAKDNARVASAHLRRMGVRVFAVGVSGSHYRDLSMIASRPALDHVYSLAEDNDVMTEICDRVCNAQC